MTLRRSIWVLCVLLWGLALGRALDLSNAVLMSAPNLSGPQRKALVMLVEEVEKRTGIRCSSSRFGYFATTVGCCASRDGWQGDVGGQAGEGLGTCRRVRELAGGGGWRVERGFLDRSARCGGPARLADRVWAHLS